MDMKYITYGVILWTEYCEYFHLEDQPEPEWFQRDLTWSMNMIIKCLAQSHLVPTSRSRFLLLKQQYQNDVLKGICEQVKFAHENQDIIDSGWNNTNASFSLGQYHQGPQDRFNLDKIFRSLCPASFDYFNKIGWTYASLNVKLRLDTYYKCGTIGTDFATIDFVLTQDFLTKNWTIFNFQKKLPDFPVAQTQGYLKAIKDEAGNITYQWVDISGLTNAVTWYQDTDGIHLWRGDETTGQDIDTLASFYNKTQTYSKTEVNTELAKKTDKELTSANGKALIFNETDGGGAKFEHVDNTWSFVGVNDGGSTGLAAQIYAVDSTSRVGARLNITKNGIFYTVANSAAYTIDDELATIGEVAQKQDKLPTYVQDKFLKVVDDGTGHLILTWATVGGFDPTQYYTIAQTDALLADKADQTDLDLLEGRVDTAETNIALKLNISDVINDLTHTDINKALSANQGNVLQQEIEALQQIGRFLSTWNAVTGKPDTDPTSLPYEYQVGDYYIISTTGANNFRPEPTEYTGDPSTIPETESIGSGDFYIYDGTSWSLLLSHRAEITFAQITGNPMLNTQLAPLFNAKVNTSDFEDLEDDVETNTNNISALDTRLESVENSITAIQTRLTTDEGKITDHETRLVTVENDLNGKEAVANKVTTISGSSTDTEYPSAKAVYELTKTKLEASMCTYQTEAPTEDITDGGVHIVYLDEDPADVTKYNGYIYLFKEEE